ncbi:class I SAM-dependent methyltransferase [Marinobacterium sediminicola]|uniref:Ribosomal RNA small subunit methyltransferase J n=1 Tax=Marinobacterium sediminicola TaxID=518898 RepID=A0ABY1S081_9GAMM|nr:class I SAM-dependent methyltransferase [Marinobacterium sediminicola]ULG69978.1 class I SAM-dependent methyltransferase [Marinobacterium sediminicola]SMR74429.1 16S rRNA (guanine1516-N2)-methyltransferase [Marinobacterium sediminicola]
MTLAVGWETLRDESRARVLAERLQLPLVAQPDLSQDETWSQILLVAAGEVALCATGRKRPGPVKADFTGGAVAHRRQFGGGTGQLIAKACGIKGGIRPNILDATAGLGRDAFVLATLGCRVHMLERSPVVHALLESGLEQAAAVGDLDEIIGHMTLEQADGRQWLEQCSAEQAPDLIYLDPMFPHTDKKALVKKEMLAFRELVGYDSDDRELLAAALKVARYRVVVKRARKAPAIEGPAPTYTVDGKSSRYDIYALKALGSD